MSYRTDTPADFLDNIGSEITGLAVPFSIVAWVKQTTTEWDSATVMDILSFGDDTIDTNNSVRLQHSAALTARAATYDSAGVVTSASYVKADASYEGEWVVVVGVWDDQPAGTADTVDNTYVYLQNSTNSGTTATDKLMSGAVFDSIKIGARLHNDGADFEGLVGEVAVFNKALSAAEIDALQTGPNAGPTPKSVAPANCVCYWPMDTDQSTHANEGSDAAGTLTVRSACPYSSDHPTITGVIDSVSFESDGVTDISDTHGLTLVANDVVVCCISNNKATNDFVINDDNAGAFIPITARVQGSTFAHRCFYYIVPSKNPLTVFNFDMNSYSGRMSRTYIQVRGAYLPDLISSALTTETPSASLMPQANDTDRNNTLMLAFCTDDSISTAGDDITGWDSFAEVIEANGAAGQIQAAASYNQVEKGTPPTDTIVQSVIWTVVGINSIGKDVKPTAVPLVITLPTTIPRAMLLDDLTPDYFEATIVPVATTPISMAAWTYPDDNINNDFCVMQIQDSAIGSEYIRFGISHSGDPEGVNKRVSGFWNNSGTLAQVVSTAETTYNAWNHFGIALDVNDQAAYLNGGSKGTNTNTLGALTGLDSISVGREGDSTFGDDWSGGLLWPAIWNAILTDEEFALLAGGIPPWMIRPDALRFCARLDGSNDGLRDIVSGQVLTITGTPELMQAPLNKLQLPQKKIFMGQPDFTKQNLVVLP